jgi:hypothetical protein
MSPEQELFLKQIDGLVASHALHGSESLCKLLQYLAKYALEHPNTPSKILLYTCIPEARFVGVIVTW